MQVQEIELPAGGRFPSPHAGAIAPSVQRRVARPRTAGWSFYPVVKRGLDIAVAATALLLLAPLFLLIAVAIQVGSPGPPFFRQERVGRYGRRFRIYKFRTMVADRRREQGSIEFPDRRHSLKSERDPRVTRVGSWLRRTSLDELPQLLNILQGTMSLVGPRPEVVEMLQYYRPAHYLRHAVVPGLTGWWQINGRCLRGAGIDPETDLRQKLADDLTYIQQQSFWFDLGIILATVPVVLRWRGAL